MARGFLLIGIGGSGGATLRYAEREVMRRLHEIGWREGMPEAWRFLHIDVPAEPDVVRGDVPAETGSTFSYLGLAHADRRYRDYDADLIRQRDQLSHIAGWRPDPARDYAPPYKGAGQRRVVGRVVASTRFSDVKREIDEQLSLIADAGDQLRRLDDLALNKLGGVLGRGEKERNIVVVSSLGGGSGSGIFIDVLELLTAEEMDEQTLPILYAGDVFAQLSKEASHGIEANSLAAISELMSAFDHRGPISEDEARFLARTGTRSAREGKRIGCVSFFIGRGNGAMTFADSADVFRSMGRAISAFMLVPAVAEDYGTYVGNNVEAGAIQPEFGLVYPKAKIQAASSMGYASVTLGRSHFAEYMAERLARGALDTLLRGHRRDLGHDDLSKDETLINRLVCGDSSSESGDNLGIRVQFFEATGLWEESPRNNQVLDALRSVEDKKRRLRELTQRVVEELQKSSAERSAGQWLESFRADFDAAEEQFLAEDRADRSRRARQWTQEVQGRLCDATANYVGMYGLPVTIKLLDELSDQLSRAADELDADAARYLQEEGRYLRGVRQVFEGITEKLITPRHQAFSQAAKQRRDALRRVSESDLYTLAAKLMREIRNDVVPPLRNALEATYNRLESGERSDHARLVQQWSTGPVSAHLRPAPNEFLLEPVDEFPDRAGAVLMELLESSAERNAEREAISELISGAWKKSSADRAEQTLIKTEAKWHTANQEARDPGSAPIKASFSTSLDVPSLIANARSWVRTRESLSSYMSGSLATWLNPKEVDAGERGRAFTNALGQAFASSAPLVKVDPAVYMRVCGEDPPAPARVMGDIPMAADHPEYERVRELLIRSGVPEGDVDKRFNPNSTSGSVEISSFMSKSMHPIVLESIFDPIQEDWMGRHGPARDQFWDFRRARLLPAFVPLSPGRQIAMVRGWVIANALGQFDESSRSIWTPRGQKAFPDHLLGRGSREPLGLLPALMETLPLAMTAYANGDVDELDAYRRLLVLGASSHDPESIDGQRAAHPAEVLADAAAFGENPADYRLGFELSMWLDHGKLTQPDAGFPEAPLPPAEISGAPTDAPEERARKLEQSFGESMRSFAQFIDEFETITPETTLTIPTRWEIRGRIEQAIQQLHNATTAYLTSDREPAVRGVRV